MQNLTISIPHQLTRDEVKRRIQEQVQQLQHQAGSMVSQIDQRWTNDTLDFTVHAMGQSITGKAIVEDQVVHVEVVLPWMLAMLAGTLKQNLEQKGRQLLGKKP